jgi:hypothetical protein
MNMTPVTIISRHCEVANVTYSLLVPTLPSDEAMLSHAFHETNRVDGNEFISRTEIRVSSTSVGDLALINGNHYLCDCGGWTKLTINEAVEWQRLDQRDTGMGLAGCANRIS